jgi:hypothetical protein
MPGVDAIPRTISTGQADFIETQAGKQMRQLENLVILQ